jgi:4-hydroxy-tetrahydrodipicolinate reductase
MPRPESGFSCVIEETHHKEKKDAPSGTAKALKEIVESLGFTDVPIHSTRGGTVVGIHRVRFLGDGEEICLEHNAGDRRLFARGALIAAISLYKKEKAGLYTLEDLLENN